MITINLQNICEANDLPTLTELETWVKAALQDSKENVEVTVRVVDQNEMTELNSRFRKKNKPTNILSFPYEFFEEIELDLPYLGDLVVCEEVMREEAKECGLTLTEHWAHLIIHGVLHLQGFDHETEDEAVIMEKIETDLMKNLGFEDPYGAE